MIIHERISDANSAIIFSVDRASPEISGLVRSVIEDNPNHGSYILNGYMNLMEHSTDYSSVDLDDITVGIVTLTVGHWDLMDEHIRSIYQTYPHPKEFYIVPNIDFGMSLGAALNKGIKRALKDGCDYVVYSADDVVVGEGAIQTLVSHLIVNDLWITHGLAHNTSGWDTFAASPALFVHVGFFDEFFYPAYFEDNSFDRRLTLKNPKKQAYIPVELFHKKSQTINRMDPQRLSQHHADFSRVQRLYTAMWGGPPGHETYTIPWNGDPPQEFEGIKITKTESWRDPRYIWPSADDLRDMPNF